MASPGRQEARPWRVLVGNDGRRSFIGLSAPRQGKENFANLPSFLGAGRLSRGIDHRPSVLDTFSRKGRETIYTALLPNRPPRYSDSTRETMGRDGKSGANSSYSL